MLLQGEQSVGKTPCPEEAVQASAKTLRNSLDDASSLKLSCNRGSRVCKKPSKAEVVEREHRSVGPRISSHNTCLEDVSGELPIGCVAGPRMSVWNVVSVQSESVKPALRHPWIHSPHCSVDGDLRWSCSKCGRASTVVFPSTVVEIRALPAIPRL